MCVAIREQRASLANQPPARFTIQPCFARIALAASHLSPCNSMLPAFTVPPVPHAALSSLPSLARPAESSASPRITVTAFPPRPPVSRDTRTMPSPAGFAALFPHEHCATGLRQSGHIRPDSVEYTSPGPGADFVFMRSLADRRARWGCQLQYIPVWRHVVPRVWGRTRLGGQHMRCAVRRLVVACAASGAPACQIVSATILIAPHGHSASQIPQPLQ